MHFLHICTAFVILSGICSAFFKLEKDDYGLFRWNDLRATWGKEVTGKYFDRLPRTTDDALKNGFVKFSDCDVKAKWRGARYVQESDPYTMLLFDVNGFIAGIQTAVTKDMNSSFPSAALMPPFEKNEDMYLLSVYFVPPATICTTGRTEEQFQKEGTGIGLYMQHGSDPESDYIVGPRHQNDTANTLWQEGKFIKTMGLHFWYNLTVDMGCDSFTPYFVMYNEGQLTSFGFALPINHPSPRYEHPPIRLLGAGMIVVPKCINHLEAISTWHVFLTDVEVKTEPDGGAYLGAGYPLHIVSCFLTLLLSFLASF